jgi:hypothetical protein
LDGAEEFRGAGSTAEKSAALSLESVHPAALRVAASVLLSPPAAPLPSKSVAPP